MAVLLFALNALAAVGARAQSAAAPSFAGCALAPLQFSCRRMGSDWRAWRIRRFGFAFSVQGRVLVRTNYAEYAASDRGPASRHDDLMVIYAENGAIHADYFDNEDHIIRYTAQVRGATDVVFVSEARASEPRYRLSYSMGADGTLKGQFEIAPPGAPAAFKSYPRLDVPQAAVTCSRPRCCWWPWRAARSPPSPALASAAS